MGEHRLYRTLVHLYPSEFRREYGDDLVQHFDDLVNDRGARAAWTRTSVDFTITVPRYHLEYLMKSTGSTVLFAVIVALAFAAVGAVFVGVDSWLSVPLLALAVALGVTQCSALARSLRVPGTERRSRRLKMSGILGAVFVACYAVYLFTIGDSWTFKETALALVGSVAMVGAIGYLVAGLATPRTPPAQVASSN